MAHRHTQTLLALPLFSLFFGLTEVVCRVALVLMCRAPARLAPLRRLSAAALVGERSPELSPPTFAVLAEGEAANLRGRGREAGGQNEGQPRLGRTWRKRSAVTRFWGRRRRETRPCPPRAKTYFHELCQGRPLRAARFVPLRVRHSRRVDYFLEVGSEVARHLPHCLLHAARHGGGPAPHTHTLSLSLARSLAQPAQRRREISRGRVPPPRSSFSPSPPYRGVLSLSSAPRAYVDSARKSGLVWPSGSRRCRVAPLALTRRVRRGRRWSRAAPSKSAS